MLDRRPLRRCRRRNDHPFLRCYQVYVGPVRLGSFGIRQICLRFPLCLLSPRSDIFHGVPVRLPLGTADCRRPTLTHGLCARSGVGRRVVEGTRYPRGLCPSCVFGFRGSAGGFGPSTSAPAPRLCENVFICYASALPQEAFGWDVLLRAGIAAKQPFSRVPRRLRRR